MPPGQRRNTGKKPLAGSFSVKNKIDVGLCTVELRRHGALAPSVIFSLALYLMSRNHVYRITQDFTHVQENISQNFTSRLEALKLGRDLTDEELAVRVGLSRRMLYLIRMGKASITRKTWYKLEQAEIAAGIKRSGGVAEEPGQYTTRSQDSEMRRDLLGMQKDLATMGTRVKSMLEKLDKGRSGR